tara:strand:+ start:339 stop:725 length:387 start_codon:yes stop_codon:yes gene_type:complete
MTVLIAAVIILIIFCIALRLNNKPENVAKKREQKRLMKEKKIRRENEKALLSITEEFLSNPENRGEPVDYEFRCMRNPFFNIESDEYFELHMKRLEKRGVSKYQGKEYHKDKRGIYTLSDDGTRNYKK